MTKPFSYRDAGVSIDTANEAVKKISSLAKATFNERTLTDIGSFGGMFDARFPDLEEPVLVSSADGVGTKLKLAFLTDTHKTIGQDLVNHCVGDILVQGARPLFFMDYFATGKLSPEIAASVVEGLSIACRQNGCVLLGGETAEMPGFYKDGEYDLAGFIVGVVDRRKVIDGSTIRPGDVVLGLPSTGLHTNGYSLARKLFFEIAEYPVDTRLIELEGAEVGEVLLRPHRSYLPVLDGLLDQDAIKGLAHITGGGLLENIPRILPGGMSVEIERGSWPELPVFGAMQKLGKVEDNEMFRTFNMGIGMTVICSRAGRRKIIDHIEGLGDKCYEIGMVVEGDGVKII
ncbi:MAG: phosphoribosylformylglycinamidine cyclo-ligase [Acidobacteriota bacterium]|nr:phosphoribosylformylglycinamidine cyclo-ligase [Acidobacteriota bacterium]MDH3528550.1 phosphoribosylformylglycinamidine cyclo-ligase [Acidobacteriota bacterium]